MWEGCRPRTYPPPRISFPPPVPPLLQILSGRPRLNRVTFRTSLTRRDSFYL